MAGSDRTPIKVRLCVTIERHEEADTIIPQQLVDIANQGVTCVRVICHDTEVLYYSYISTTCTN